MCMCCAGEQSEWVITDPGECSTDCGGGTRIATIKCRTPIGNLYEAEDESDCFGAGPKPDKVYPCNTAECIYSGISSIRDTIW